MTLRIGTAQVGSTFFHQGQSLQTVLEPQFGTVEILETPTAGIDNPKRLDRGEIDLGFMASNWVGLAHSGKAPFTDPIAVRIAAPMNAGPLFFLTKASSPLRTISDLAGRRVVYGPKGSGMAEHAASIFGALGIEPIPVFLDHPEGAKALIDGEADAQIQRPIPNETTTWLSSHTEVRVIGFGKSQLEELFDKVPFYRPTVIAKGAIPGLDEDSPQPAVVNILVTHAKVDEEKVHDAVRTIVAKAGELGRINELFVGLSELFEPLRTGGAEALSFGGAKLHDGAVRAYREAGLLAR